MSIPAWRQKQLAEKEAAREEQYHERMGDLLGVNALSLEQPYAPALYGDAGIVCTACRPFSGVAPLKLTMPAENLCERCGKRLDHVRAKD